MGLFSGKRPTETMDEYTAKQRKRQQDREAESRRGKRIRPRQISPFDSKMAQFHQLTHHRAFDEAMRVWYGLVDESPDELASWLDDNPGFKPKYGIHYGPHGSEPWRPVVKCKSCGQRHRYGAECLESPGNYL